ncbi:alpha/beta family hydrolase [Acanthopleuribacter pedis]|uniref:Dienelactone hydrolase family protein n=1 Tax=Acanthopleuribacter pedis TaxID=442870 RepID=A0A8J7Q6B5_9BACT|nr:alpha/beta family hydrolase [Acanthopleuribacter pedis]MBO1318429.1 dienelactone hydrolase family protein [Acanthopleuribacter pedis]
MTQTPLIDGPDEAPLRLILAHGAGAPMDSDFMNHFAAGVASFGIQVIRFEFPYMQRRRTEGVKAPPNQEAVLLEAWAQQITAVQARGPVAIGGKSMGGRMASLIADKHDITGLICLGYPFHPPGKPEKLRTAHLTDLKTPTLIVQGTRDTLGNQEEVAGYPLSPAIEISWLEDGDHSFKPRKKSGFTEEGHLQIAATVAAGFLLRRLKDRG